MENFSFIMHVIFSFALGGWIGLNASTFKNLVLGVLLYLGYAITM